MPDDEAEAPVLRVLAQTALGVSPAGVAANVRALTDRDLPLETVASVLRDFEDRGLAETLDVPADYYRLTDAGRDRADAAFGADAFGYVD